MPWIEDPAYPAGFRWERADAQPPTELLPIIPPAPAPELPRRVPGATLTSAESPGCYEDDEPVERIEAAFASGEKHVTAPPERPPVDDPALTQPAPLPLISTAPDQPFPYDTFRVETPAQEDPVALGSGPIETKVATATTAAAVATALSNLLLWVLETYVLHTPAPDVVSGAVQTLLIAGATFAAGWAARHTPRPDVQADPADIE